MFWLRNGGEINLSTAMGLKTEELLIDEGKTELLFFYYFFHFEVSAKGVLLPLFIQDICFHFWLFCSYLFCPGVYHLLLMELEHHFTPKPQVGKLVISKTRGGHLPNGQTIRR